MKLFSLFPEPLTHFACNQPGKPRSVHLSSSFASVLQVRNYIVDDSD